MRFLQCVVFLDDLKITLPILKLVRENEVKHLLLLLTRITLRR